jgi:hypothetical protein
MSLQRWPMGQAPPTSMTTQLEPRASSQHRRMLLLRRPAWYAVSLLVVMIPLQLTWTRQRLVVVQSQKVAQWPPPPKKLYPDLRLCRFSPRMPQRDQPPIEIFPNFPTEYQCEGPAYDTCAAAVRAVARNVSQRASSTWSKPGIPLVRPGSLLLFIGNSHTRQIYETLACQYQEDILSTNSNGTNVTLRHDIVLQSSINLPWHYDVTTNLTERFLAELGHYPSDYDAIILGDFNGEYVHYNFSLAYTRREGFYNLTVEKAAAANITMNGVLQLKDFAAIFDGPILRLTGGGPANATKVRNAQAQVHQELQKTNKKNTNRFVVLDASKYVPQVGVCGHNRVGSVVIDTPLVGDPLNWHRCQGGKGGPADLVAYDVVEALGQLLPSTSTYTTPIVGALAAQ